MPVFSYVLQKVSRWELPSFHLPRREFSSPLFGGHLSASHSRMAATRCHCESCDTLGVPLSGSPASPTGAAPSGSSASGSSASPSGAGVVLSGSSASHSRMAATRCHCESCDTLGVPLSGSPASPTGAAPSGSSASGSSASPSGAGVVLSGSSASHSRMAATRCHCESCDTLGVPLSGSPASPTGAAPSGSSASPSGAGVVLSGSSASHSRMAATRCHCESCDTLGVTLSGSSASPTGAAPSGLSASPSGAGVVLSGSSASPTGARSGSSASPTGARSGSSASPTGADQSGTSASPTGALLSGASARPTGAPSGSSASTTGAEHSGTSASPTGAVLSGMSHFSSTASERNTELPPIPNDVTSHVIDCCDWPSEAAIDATSHTIQVNDFVDLIMSPTCETQTVCTERVSQSALYIPCNCRKCDCDLPECTCKPCQNAWFNWRLIDKSTPFTVLFCQSAIEEMLYGRQITVSTALEIFDIPFPCNGSLPDTEMLLRHLSNIFKFVLLCEQCGAQLTVPALSGGGKRRGKPIGRKQKKMKIRVPNKSTVTNEDPPSNDNESGSLDINQPNLNDMNNQSQPMNDDATQSRQAKYKKSDIGRATEKRYSSSVEGKAAKNRASKAFSQTDRGKSSFTDYAKSALGKAAKAKANTNYSKSDYGKAAKAKSNTNYSKSDYGKAALAKANADYAKSDHGKAAQAKAYADYAKSDHGKAAQAKANADYAKSDHGKAAQAKAYAEYAKSDHGKAAHAKAYAKYAKSDHGKAASNAAHEAYAQTVKRRLSRKKYAHIKKKYFKRYMPFYRELEKVLIDFSSEKVDGNTKSLMGHVVSPEFAQKFESFKDEILKGRCMMSEPQQYRTGSMKTAAAYYKLTLSNVLSSAMDMLSIDNDSWDTLPGLSKKILKRFKHFNPRNFASKYLTNLAWLKRQQCVTALKIQLDRLSSFTEAVISKINLLEKDSDQKAALLGLQCHQKTSEPFHTRVSYVDGLPYNYLAEDQKYEEAKDSNKKNPSHIMYKCNDQCIISDNKEDLVKLRNLFEECAKLADSSPQEFPRFLQKFQWCTKWQEYPESEKGDLNPLRMYLFPVKHRSHPEGCYIPPQGEDCPDPLKKSGCKSQEVTMRKFMVHYKNPRKFYSMICKALTAHKLMCDIDTATIIGDVQYLSKLVKINLQYDDATVGFNSESEARKWTADTIEEKMGEIAVQGKTKKTTYSRRNVFDSDRLDLPTVRCHCCNKLVTQKQSSIIDLSNAKKLKYDPEKGIQPHQVFENLQTFLVDKGIIQTPNSGEIDDDRDDEDSFENHPTRHLHGLSICNSCRITLNKGEIPANSMMNNMFTGETPEVLKVLNPIELMFVSKTKCFQTIVKPGPISSKLPQSERLSAIKGNLIHLPLSTSSTAAKLYGKSATERLFDVEDLVQLYGQPTKDKKVWNHIVDRKKVHAALIWLFENNPNYKEIIVPAVAEDILPHVFGYACDVCQQEFDSEKELNEHKKGCINHGPISSDSKSDQIDNENCSQLPDVFAEEECSSHQCASGTKFADDVDSNESEQSDNASDPNENGPCKEGPSLSLQGSGNSSDCFSSMEVDSNQSDSNIKDKPWIEQVPRDSLKNGFQQFSVVGNESNPERDTFKMLKIGSDPVPYYEPNLDCTSFPERYPFGSGGLTAQREKDLTDSTFEQTRIMTSNNYHRRNLQYLFHLTGQKEKRLIKSGIFGVLNKNCKSMSKKDILDGAHEENPALLKRMTSVLKKLPTQRAFWTDVKTKVEAMVFEFGPPTFWATFSPGEYDDEDMLKFLREKNSDLPGVENMTVSQLVCKDPILACTYLQKKFDATLKFLLSDANPIGKVKHHFVRTEYQTRLMPHFHCIFWIEDAPIIGQDSEDVILDFIGKYISCKLPSPNEDPVMHGLVKKFELHKCNSYCLRHPKKCRGKARCKFSFPRSPCLKPVLHGVASSIASHKTGSYKKRLYELQRKENEKCINDYNPILLYLWKGNVDIQFIGEKSESLVEYISKYATKAPKSEITDFDLNAMKNENKSTWAQLFQIASRLMKDRELGAMEARNLMLSENPIQTDASFLFINTVYASKRKSMLKSKQLLKSLPDDSKDIYYGDLIGTWYPKRPPYHGSTCLKNMSLYEFASTYERLGNAAAAKIKDKSGLLRLDGNAGYMKRQSNDQKKALILYGPSYLDPIKDSEAYYFSFLLLHKPFWHESLLMGSSNSYQLEFERLQDQLPAMAAHEAKVRRKKNFRKDMEKEAEATAHVMSATDANGSDSQNIDSGSDLFETVRKQTIIETEEQLNEAVAGLSPDQLAVYNLFVQNVDHFYQHKAKTCSCEEFEPIRLFVSGFGGSGKSHLIRTLMAYQFIRSEVNKEPCHFLLGAPTGIASHNIGGMTLHSMWNLPVDHSNGKRNSVKEYRKLKSGQINIMRANYAHVCGLIVDEVSMISNRMLMAINMRMNEVVGSKDPKPFSGIPIVVFGDLFQLEPVSGSQPFVPLSNNIAKQMFGGFPCVPNLWEGFQFRQLNTNHRQQGDENKRWRATLDHVRFGTLTSSDVDYLNERIIDTSGCKLKAEYLDRYVSKFLECEDTGSAPVCLLPENKMVEEFNAAVMQKKGEVPVKIDAIDKLHCPKDKDVVVRKLLASLESNETGGLEAHLNLAINTRVMLRVNDKRTPGLVNGARGTIREIVSDSSGKVATKILVKFDGIDKVQAIERTERKFQVQPKCFVYRKMFPLINSYAMTIHKSQSLSLSCVFADLGDKIFADGMSYVALSRCLSQKGLYVMNFNPAKVLASEKACKEYSRLLGTGRMNHNQGCKNRKLERYWYTTNVIRKATGATAEKIRQQLQISKVLLVLYQKPVKRVAMLKNPRRKHNQC